MRIAITGSRGQLGTELRRVLGGEHEILGVDRPEYDVTDLRIIDHIAEMEPNLVIHTAAMTDVDGCARKPEAAYAVNALGTRNVALGCQKAGAEMLYISTNEVLDGTKDSPYWEFDEPNPINAYGKSKLAGERYVQFLLNRFYIVRTSWLFGKAGNNFVKKILDLADREGKLRVVSDEVASPTYALDLAQAINKLVEGRIYGIYHLANAGGCSRFDYAKMILELAGRGEVSLVPISSEEFTRASKPPRQSCLHNFCGQALGISLRPWEEALAAFLNADD
jgi:dTDP-4-dehydrorhamnose reductase